MAELKEFDGWKKIEERARNGISKMKSAFLRDQAPDAEKFLVFSDLFSEPVRYCYNQLSSSTRTLWKALLEGFMTKYGGKNRVLVWILYNQARKRSNETSLEYLYRLNVAAIRAKIPIRDGSPASRKEHVNHYIVTLYYRDLAIMLTMLRLGDADDLEEMLQECENMEVRESHTSMGSSKLRQRVAPQAAQVPAKSARAVRAIHVESESSGSDIDACGSTSDSDRHKGYMATATDCAQKPDRYNVYMTTAADRATNPGEPIIRREQVDRDRHYDRGKPQTVCTHCGSKRHDDRGCWKRFACQKCGRKGHPDDNADYVCSVCKDVHEE